MHTPLPVTVGAYVVNPNASDADARAFLAAATDHETYYRVEDRRGACWRAAGILYFAGTGTFLLPIALAKQPPAFDTMNPWAIAATAALYLAATVCGGFVFFMPGPESAPNLSDYQNVALRLRYETGPSTSDRHTAATRGHGSLAHRTLWELARLDDERKRLTEKRRAWEMEGVSRVTLARADRTQVTLERRFTAVLRDFTALVSDPVATANAEAALAGFGIGAAR